MDVLIWVDGNDGDGLLDLYGWLGEEPELSGNVRLSSAAVAETELGGVADVVSVALATGGAGTVLASSLVTWLQTRRTVIRLAVQRGDRTLILDLETTERILPLIERHLESGDDP